MANANISQFAPDCEIWDSLKQAIARSSGFKNWLQQQETQPQSNHDNLDDFVISYLRETLETLAY
jgi:hypothetical protein